MCFQNKRMAPYMHKSVLWEPIGQGGNSLPLLFLGLHQSGAFYLIFLSFAPPHTLGLAPLLLGKFQQPCKSMSWRIGTISRFSICTYLVKILFTYSLTNLESSSWDFCLAFAWYDLRQTRLNIFHLEVDLVQWEWTFWHPQIRAHFRFENSKSQYLQPRV